LALISVVLGLSGVGAVNHSQSKKHKGLSSGGVVMDVCSGLAERLTLDIGVLNSVAVGILGLEAVLAALAVPILHHSNVICAAFGVLALSAIAAVGVLWDLLSPRRKGTLEFDVAGLQRRCDEPRARVEPSVIKDLVDLSAFQASAMRTKRRCMMVSIQLLIVAIMLTIAEYLRR
jgi:hypothetical protein